MEQPPKYQLCANCLSKMTVTPCPYREMALPCPKSKPCTCLMYTELKRCNQCKVVSYCNRDCQVEHWHYSHKKMCKVLSGRRPVMKVRHDVDNCMACRKDNNGEKCQSREFYDEIVSNYWRYFDCTPSDQSQCPFLPGECTGQFANWPDMYLYLISSLLREAVTSAGAIYFRNPKAVRSYSIVQKNFLMLRSRYWSYLTLANGKNKSVAEVMLADTAFSHILIGKTNYFKHGALDFQPSNALMVLNNLFKGKNKNSTWEKLINTTSILYEMLRSSKFSVLNFDNLSPRRKNQYGLLIGCAEYWKFESQCMEPPQSLFHQLPADIKCTGCNKRLGGRQAQCVAQFGKFSWLCTQKEDQGNVVHVRFPEKPITLTQSIVSCGNNSKCLQKAVEVQAQDLTALGRLLNEFLFHSIICNGCLRYSLKTHKCSQCRMVAYCSQSCLDKDWVSHKAVCREWQGEDNSHLSRRGRSREMQEKRAEQEVRRLDPLYDVNLYVTEDDQKRYGLMKFIAQNTSAKCLNGVLNNLSLGQELD